MATGGGLPDGGRISHSGTGLTGRITAPGLRWHKDFPGDERKLCTVRRWLTSLLPDCEARDDVTSVASELAANAILSPGLVRCRVRAAAS